MYRFSFVGMVSLGVVVSLLGAQPTSAQVTLDPAWDPNPKTFGGPDYDYANSVQQTTDGGYIVAGTTASWGAADGDVYLIKLDAQGNLDSSWDANPKTFGGEGWHSADSVQQTTDGGYIVAGHTWIGMPSFSYVYLIKLDSAGNLDPAWDPNPRRDHRVAASSVRQTTDGGYIVAGWDSWSGAASWDLSLAKLDGEGNLDQTWEANPKTFGGEGHDKANSVQQTTDGGYIVAGESESLGAASWDVSLIKLDSQGDLDPTWETNPKTFGGEGHDKANSVQQTTDGGYVIAGWTSSFGAGDWDVYLIKLDSQGNLDPTWDPNPKTFGGEESDGANSVQQTTDGGYIVAGESESLGAGWYDVYLIKLDSMGNLDPAWDPNPKTFGGEGTDSARSVQQTTDGGYIVAGQTVTDYWQGGRNGDVLVLKLAPARHFLRGDCNSDGSAQGIPDALFLLNYFFLSGDTPPCRSACDANGDGKVTGTTDAIYILRHFFQGGEPPPLPFPACGAGQLWTDGPLTCETEPPCP